MYSITIINLLDILGKDQSFWIRQEWVGLDAKASKLRHEALALGSGKF